MSDKLVGKLAENDKLLLQIYKDALQPGVKQVGVALGSLLRVVLYPVSKLPASLADRWDITSSVNLEKYRERMSRVPPEAVTPVPPEIGVPIMEKLSYVRDEDLSTMFVNLLTKASVAGENNVAHPSFIERISNLTSDEARILQHIHTQHLRTIPFVVVWMAFEEPHGIQRSDRLTGFETMAGLRFPANLPVYMENLVALGMLVCNDLTRLSNETHYRRLNGMYEDLRRQTEEAGHEDGKRYPVVLRPGYYDITNYGRMFLSACVRDDVKTAT